MEFYTMRWRNIYGEKSTELSVHSFTWNQKKLQQGSWLLALCCSSLVAVCGLPQANFIFEGLPEAAGFIVKPFSLSRSVKCKRIFLLPSLHLASSTTYHIIRHVQGDGGCGADRGWLLLRLRGDSVQPSHTSAPHTLLPPGGSGALQLQPRLVCFAAS